MTAAFIQSIFPTMPGAVARETCDPEWRAILRQIYRGDSQVATDVYVQYHRAIRDTLRRRTGCDDVADAVLDVLIAAIRRVRCCDLKTRQEFEHAIDDLARDEALVMRDRVAHLRLLPEITLHRKGELLDAVFTKLNPLERQIVLRAYLLHQKDFEIAAAFDLPPESIESARIKARTLYLSIHPVSQPCRC